MATSEKIENMVGFRITAEIRNDLYPQIPSFYIKVETNDGREYGLEKRADPLFESEFEIAWRHMGELMLDEINKQGKAEKGGS